jgi:hypothetical protein
LPRSLLPEAGVGCGRLVLLHQSYDALEISSSLSVGAVEGTDVRNTPEMGTSAPSGTAPNLSFGPFCSLGDWGQVYAARKIPVMYDSTPYMGFSSGTSKHSLGNGKQVHQLRWSLSARTVRESKSDVVLNLWEWKLSAVWCYYLLRWEGRDELNGRLVKWHIPGCRAVSTLNIGGMASCRLV